MISELCHRKDVYFYFHCPTIVAWEKYKNTKRNEPFVFLFLPQIDSCETCSENDILQLNCISYWVNSVELYKGLCRCTEAFDKNICDWSKWNWKESKETTVGY